MRAVFCCELQIVGSKFGINILSALFHPAFYHRFKLLVQYWGDIFLAHFHIRALCNTTIVVDDCCCCHYIRDFFQTDTVPIFWWQLPAWKHVTKLKPCQTSCTGECMLLSVRKLCWTQLDFISCIKHVNAARIEVCIALYGEKSDVSCWMSGGNFSLSVVNAAWVWQEKEKWEKSQLYQK